MAAGNARILTKLVVVTLGMFGFGFALVPFYYKICEVTGINSGDVQSLAKNTQVDESRWVTLEFDANTNAALPWQFKPMQRRLKVHPGQLVQVEYEVTNTSDRAIVGRAVPSYGPARAAAQAIPGGQYVGFPSPIAHYAVFKAPNELKDNPIFASFMLDIGIIEDKSIVCQ